MPSRRGGRGATPSAVASANAPRRVVDVVDARQAELERRAADRERRCPSRPRSSIARDGDVERRPGVAAARAAVVAEVAEVDRRVAVGVAAAHAGGRVGRVGEVGERDRRVVEAEPDDVGATVAERADDRVVGRQHEQRLGRQARRPSSASARPPAPARRSGRAGRGTGCESSSARGRVRRAISGSANSSTSNSPSCAPAGAVSSALATPDSRFAPAPLRHSSCSGSSAAASSAELVVLPLVAETSTTPSGSRAARRSMASGARRSSALPGRLVPPPRPLRRDSDPITRAAAVLAGKRLTRAHRSVATPVPLSVRPLATSQDCSMLTDQRISTLVGVWRSSRQDGIPLARASGALYQRRQAVNGCDPRRSSRHSRTSIRSGSPSSRRACASGTPTRRSWRSSAPARSASASRRRCASSRPTPRRPSIRRP